MEQTAKGSQQSGGYIIDADEIVKTVPNVPTIHQGEILLMSAFLPHRTYVNPDFDGWKLSLSRRIDDLNDDDWRRRGYRNAYGTVVDRQMYET
ncbi:MAG: hypothetical protein ACPGXY_03370 [Alphaproteobacteria bacterium]